METLRHVRFHTGHTLRIWDVYRRNSLGKDILGYEFRGPDGRVIFEGEDFSPGIGTAIDSDECLWGLMGFLTLKPGDTDPEYFERYTPEQLAWARSDECEQLSLEVYLAENDGDCSERAFALEEVL